MTDQKDCRKRKEPESQTSHDNDEKQIPSSTREIQFLDAFGNAVDNCISNQGLSTLEMHTLALRSILYYNHISYKQMTQDDQRYIEIGIIDTLYGMGFVIRDITDALKNEICEIHPDPDFPYNKTEILKIMKSDINNVEDLLKDEDDVLEALHSKGILIPDLADFFDPVISVTLNEEKEV